MSYREPDPQATIAKLRAENEALRSRGTHRPVSGRQLLGMLGLVAALGAAEAVFLNITTALVGMVAGLLCVVWLVWCTGRQRPRWPAEWSGADKLRRAMPNPIKMPPRWPPPPPSRPPMPENWGGAGGREAGALRRAWHWFAGWWEWLLMAGVAAGVIGGLVWFIHTDIAEREAEARQLCERVCGESLVDVRDDFGTTCLCEGDDGLRAVEPWSVDR